MRRVMMHLRLLLAGMGVLQMILMHTAMAGSLETLVMPGRVIEGHAKYEQDCNKCHQPFSKEQQSVLCRSCHEEIDADLTKMRGFHGRTPARVTECSHCHTEHKGRGADVIQLGSETFDHDGTDYSLKGAHKAARCGVCHVPGKKYRDTPSRCVTCHEKNDIHKGSLGDKCADCHGELGWKRSVFDHDKTDFVLRDRHEELECNSCHVGGIYKDTTKDCHGCHQLSDVHAGRYGVKCGQCHTEKSWVHARFDHLRDAGYALEGRHRVAKCDACHSGDLYRDKLDTKCFSCHRNDDEHSGRYGDKCGTCHTTDGWVKTKFDHDGNTKFPLRGKHDEVSCAACHRGDVHTEQLETGCHGCHASDDVHQGEEGKQCQACHDEGGWGGRIRFDHDMTGFPLIGLHAVVPCEECHFDSRFKSASMDCNGCHQKQDVHKKRLGAECNSCHNPNGWSLWVFDHDSSTEFPLNGAHEGIDCLLCHDTDATHGIKASSSCADCHNSDDVHAGQFGRYCERCHNDGAFDDVRIR